MRDHAAFLRAINVTGRRVKGPELCAVLERLGCSEVRAFRASGNLVFDAPSEPESRLTKRIEEALQAALGYEVVTFLRSSDEVRAIAAAQPFAAQLVEESNGKLQVAMLTARPPAQARKRVLAHASDHDQLAFGERELYWLPAEGTQGSELDWKAIGAELGQTTVRTKGTVEQIASKHFSG